jgi:hypothetical protein
VPHGLKRIRSRAKIVTFSSRDLVPPLKTNDFNYFPIPLFEHIFCILIGQVRTRASCAPVQGRTDAEGRILVAEAIVLLIILAALWGVSKVKPRGPEV